MPGIDNLNLKRIKEILEDPKIRKYVILGCILVFGFFYMLSIGLHKFSVLSKVLLEIKGLKNNIELVDSRVKRLGIMTQRLDELKIEIGAYSEGIPNQKELPALLEELSQIAKASNVRILSITPSDSKSLKKELSSGYYKDMPIIITAKSGYHELGYFIGDLENSRRFITIAGIGMRYNPKTPRQHDVRLILKTYVSTM